MVSTDREYWPQCRPAAACNKERWLNHDAIPWGTRFMANTGWELFSRSRSLPITLDSSGQLLLLACSLAKVEWNHTDLGLRPGFWILMMKLIIYAKKYLVFHDIISVSPQSVQHSWENLICLVEEVSVASQDLVLLLNSSRLDFQICIRGYFGQGLV